MLNWVRRRFGLRTVEAISAPIERPWLRFWDYLPKRTAGYGFTAADYAEARARAREVARATLGEGLWQRLQRQGYLDVPSRQMPDITYRLRVGRRIQVICVPGVASPWPYHYQDRAKYPLLEQWGCKHGRRLRPRTGGLTSDVVV